MCVQPFLWRQHPWVSVLVVWQLSILSASSYSNSVRALYSSFSLQSEAFFSQQWLDESGKEAIFTCHSRRVPRKLA